MQRLGTILIGVIGCVGCEVIGGYQSFEGKTEAAAPPHPCDHIVSPRASPEPEGDAAPMVLTKEASGNCFWIDQTEVTVDRYRTFVSDVSSSTLTWTGDDVASCGAWKAQPSDPVPPAADECADQIAGSSPFADEKPIRCVDWCDALAFCRWAGKGLCGSEPLGNTTDGDTTLTSWTAACNEDGFSYPYGKTLQDQVCNIGLEDKDCTVDLLGSCGPTVAPAFPRCTSPSGALNMVGNVAEWVANCGLDVDTEASQQTCTIRGGSFEDDTSVNCQRKLSRMRHIREPTLGFRCCATRTEVGEL